ncbi:MAG: VOC family protein, partial [Synechococcaceae bacterium WB6_3A_227]|nr:VOC family protein [Synechococcaceae bacterium WB6_3A_227]
MGVERLGHVAIRVADMARAKHFYQQLGMRLVWDAPDWAYLMAGTDGLALLGPSYKEAGPHFA